MISFSFLHYFKLKNKRAYKSWLKAIVTSEGYKTGNINFIFVSDKYLLDLNIKYLKHKTLTDIITFDYTEKKTIHGDIFISVERVLENAEKFKTSFDLELLRVMAHGVLHLSKYKDKTKDDAMIMRKKEDEKIKMFHVEQ